MFVSQETGYPIPKDIQPQIIYASHSYFVHRWCDDVDTAFQKCNIVGMYLIGKYEIYIDITSEAGEEKNAFLVHELTHFLQDVNNSYPGTSCNAALLRESEAYRVENDYGVLHDVPYNHSLEAGSASIFCDDDKKSAIDDAPDTTQGEGPWLPVPDPFPYTQGEGPS